jgi:hypothetical protein
MKEGNRVQCRWVYSFLRRIMFIVFIFTIGVSTAVSQPTLAANGGLNLLSPTSSPIHRDPAQAFPPTGSHRMQAPPLTFQPIQTSYSSWNPGASFRNPDNTTWNHPSAFFVNQPVIDLAAAPEAGPETGRTGISPGAAGSISGHVYETGSNAPVANASISVNTNDQNYSYGNAQTNALGYYQVTGLDPRSDYKVQVWSTGHLRAFYPSIARWENAANITVLSGQDTPNTDVHVIKADSYITGRVTNEDGSPAANVWMESFHQDGWFVGINANSNGEYSLPVIAGTWQVFPYQPPMLVEPKSIPVTSGQTVANIDFVLHPGGTISGTVRDGQGNPLANVSVELDGPNIGYGDCSNSNGEYTFTAAFNVNWRVRAASIGSYWCSESNSYAQQFWKNTPFQDQATLINLTPQAPSRTGIDFSLQPGGGISGHVYKADGVTPVQGACINLNTGAPDWIQIGGWGSTGADGFFSFYGIPTGPIYIYADAHCNELNPALINEWYAIGGSTPDGSKASAVTIQAGQIASGINFQLDQGGTISGHVYQQNGGAPIAQAWIYALTANNFNFVQGIHSGADGSYQIPGLLTGSYYIAISADGFGGVYYPNGYDDPHAQKVNATASKDTPGIDFHLLPEATISGKVFQSDGSTPIIGATVSAWPQNGGQARQSTSAADGSYTIHGLSSGNYVAKAQATGYETEYYQDSSAWYEANSIPVSQPNVTTGINFTLTSLSVSPPSIEQTALTALYQATGGTNWNNHAGWLSDPNPCTWWGVVCHDGHVVELRLQFNNLTGQLPDPLADLSQLRLLSLWVNHLGGSIPAGLGSLSSLRWLFLDGNQFTGDLPASLANLTGILAAGSDWSTPQGLYLGYNRLNVPNPYPSDPPTALEQYLLARDPIWQLTQSISAAIPTTGGNLVSRDSRTTVSFPPDSQRPDTMFQFIPQEIPAEATGSLRFAQNSFQLVALDSGGHPLDSFTFNSPITLTLHYSESDVAAVSEGLLKLYYWDKTANSWADAATTCSPTSIYTRNLVANTLSVSICHLSEFALLGPPRALYVPVIRR